MSLSKDKIKLIHLYKSALGEVRAEFMRLKEMYGEDMSYGQLQNLNRLKNLDNIIQKTVIDLGEKSMSITKDSMISLYEQSFNISVKQIPKDIQEIIGFGLIDKKAVENVIDNTFQTVTLKNINDLQQGVNEEIAKGLIKGESYDKISKQVTERYDVAANNTIRIVNTETHKVVNQAQVDVFNGVKTSAERLGYNISKKWLSANDDRTRHSHQYMNGKIADTNGDFTFASGIKTQGPGLSGIAEEDINCRCTFITEIIKN